MKLAKKKILLSFIIPTNKTVNLISNTVRDYINCIEENINFSYELIVVFNNQVSNLNNKLKNKDLLEKQNNRIKLLSKKILAFTIKSKLGPGISRNIGLKKCSGNYIWFLDDDDQIDYSEIKKIFKQIQEIAKSKILNDVIIHSLINNDYLQNNLNESKKILLKRIITHKEKQEVFNFIYNRKFLLKNQLLFKSGYHEDIFFSIKSLAHAKRIKFIAEKVYIHNKQKNSITGTYSEKNIYDHLSAALEILEFLKINKFLKKFKINNEFILVTIGVILYQSQKKKNFNFLLNCLLNFIKKDFKCILKLYNGNLEPQRNSTNFKYATLYFLKYKDDISIKNLAIEIKKIFDTNLSCKDLNSSIFLAPDEIRACCKRFFVNGRQKGDVVLVKAKKDINLETIVLKKDALIKKINKDEAEECSGCPYIERYEKKSHEQKIDYISLENFSYCNMRCTYCSPKYYGGAEAIYNSSEIIEELSKNKLIKQDCHVVWGGGEPTLSPRFNFITDVFISDPKVTQLRVLTNSLRYSVKLAEIIKNEKVQIVTSIDSGTQEKFREIRGKGEIDTVLENLKKYSVLIDDKKRIIVKYIFTKNNFETTELINFVEKIINTNLINSIFHISCDFRMDVIPERIIQAIYELGLRLLNSGAHVVFLDDLIRDRIFLDKIIAESVLAYLNKIKVETKYILSYKDLNQKKIILWGNGRQADWFINKTTFGISGGFSFDVASEEDLIKKLSNLDKNISIIPAGVQSIYRIQKNILNSKFKKYISSSLVI